MPEKVQETEEETSNLSETEVFDAAFDEKTGDEKPEEPPEEPVEEEKVEEEKEEPEDEVAEKKEETEEVEEKPKSLKEEAEEAGKKIVEEQGKTEKETEEPETKAPVKEPVKDAEVKEPEIKEPDWTDPTKDYFDEYKVEGRAIKESFIGAVKDSRDYTNKLGNFALDNFKKIDDRQTGSEKVMKDLLPEIGQMRFWLNMVLQGHGDAFTISQTDKFKKWHEKQSDNAKALYTSGNPEDAIRYIKYFKEDVAQEKVKEHDDKTKTKRQKLKDVHTHDVSSKTATAGSPKTDEEDYSSWWDEAEKEKTAKKR